MKKFETHIHRSWNFNNLFEYPCILNLVHIYS